MGLNIYDVPDIDYKFSTISGDEIYSYLLRDFSTTVTVVNNNGITTQGEFLLQNVPLETTPVILIINATQYNESTYNNWATILPLTLIKQAGNVTTTPVTTYYDVNNDRKVYISRSHRSGNPKYYTGRSGFNYNGQSVPDVSTGGVYPFGLCTPPSAGSTANPTDFYIEIVISDSNYTNIGLLNIYGNTTSVTARFYRITSETRVTWLKDYFQGLSPYVPPGPTPGDDPFAPGGTTGDDETDPTGGDGDFDNESDEIPIPLPPTAGAVDSGFITLYNPSMSQIQDLGSFMWSDLFDLDTFKKIFSDPMQAILGLSVVPVVPPRGSSVNVKIGNIQSGVFMPMVTSQYVQKDFGQITLNEYWGGYLDYAPYTQVEIYLPFIGVRPLATDDVMGKTLHLVYNIDLLSGACMAFIAVNEDVLYQFIGQCSCSVPITGNDWTNVINGVLNIAGAIGTTVATGGLSAPQAAGAVTALASSVVSSKPRVEKSGSLSGMGGMLGVFSPYLIITRPRQALPASQNAFQGYPAFITRTLGSVSGFTRVADVHLDGLTCTDAEKTEIKQLLEQGVIL